MSRDHRPSPARKWLALAVAVGVIFSLPLVSTATQPNSTPPTVKITAPAAGASLGGVIQVTGRAKDRGGVARVEVGVDGSNFAPATGTASWTFDLDTTVLADGAHTIVARGTDRDDSVGTVSVEVTVLNARPADTSPPTVGIEAPAAGATLTGTVPVSGAASDDRGISRIEIRVDGGSYSADLTVGHLVHHHRYHPIRRWESHHRRACPR